MPEEDSPTERWSKLYITNQLQGMNHLINSCAASVDEMTKGFSAIKSRWLDVEVELKQAKLAVGELKLIHESETLLLRQECDRLSKHVEILIERLDTLTGRHEKLGQAYTAHVKEQKDGGS